MSNLAEHYKVLELEYGASPEEIKQAYRDLAMVWHPDRFSDNLRLQQKAQEKLKVVNEAYANLRAYHRSEQDRANRAAQKPQSQRPPAASQQPQRPPASANRREAKAQPHVKYNAGRYNPIISLQEAKRILIKFKFNLVETGSGFCAHYRSGPFDLDIREDAPEVVLSVPCDSVDTFHRVLLSIPCKSAGMFHHSDAQELIHLLKSTLGV